MNALSYKRVAALSLVTLFFISMDVIAMDRIFSGKKPKKESTASQKDINKQLDEMVSSLQNGEWFVYRDGTVDGIVVSTAIVKLSGTLKNLLDDMGMQENSKGPLPLTGDFSGETIVTVFEILIGYHKVQDVEIFLKSIKNDLEKLSLDQLVMAINLCQYLDVPQNLTSSFIFAMENQPINFQEMIDYESIKSFNLDAQKPVLERKINKITNCLENEIEKHNQIKNKKSFRLETTMSSYFRPALSPDCRKLIFEHGIKGEEEGQLWDIQKIGEKKPKLLHRFKNYSFKSASFNPSGNQFIAGSFRFHESKDITASKFINICEVIDVKSGKYLSHIYVTANKDINVLLVEFGADGKTLVAALSNGEVLIKKPGESKATFLKDELIRVGAIALSHDCNRLALCDSGNSFVYIKDVATEKDICRISMERDLVAVRNVIYDEPYVFMAFSGDDKKILLVKNTANLFNTETGALIQRIEQVDSHDKILAVAFSADGETILFGTQNHHLYVIDAKTGKRVNKLTYHDSAVNAVGFCPEDNSIISCGQNGLIVKTFLLSKAEKDGLLEVKNCDLGQVLLLERICSALSKRYNLILTKQEKSIFKSLPKSIQKIITDIFPSLR